jgi:hypothetical protein
MELALRSSFALFGMDWPVTHGSQCARLVLEANQFVRIVPKAIKYTALGLGLVISAWGQSSPGKDVGSGLGDIGKAPVKGAGSVAKGTAKGVGDAVTLHPVGAAKSMGKGAAGAGKDVTVGTAKGTGKVAKGVGKTFKKIF